MHCCMQHKHQIIIHGLWHNCCHLKVLKFNECISTRFSSLFWSSQPQICNTSKLAEKLIVLNIIWSLISSRFFSNQCNFFFIFLFLFRSKTLARWWTTWLGNLIRFWHYLIANLTEIYIWNQAYFFIFICLFRSKTPARWWVRPRTLSPRIRATTQVIF